jgi:hypothetical protein
MRTRISYIFFSILVILSLSGVILHAQDVRIFWQKLYEDFGSMDINSMIPTSDNGFFLTGPIFESKDNIDCWAMKFNHLGSIEWYKEFGSAGQNEIPHSCIQLKDKSYILCGEQKDRMANTISAWMMKLDFRGSVIWEKSYERGRNDALYAICRAPDNGFVVAGRQNIDDVQKSDAFILECNSDGETIWETVYGGINNDAVYSIAATPDGYAICGARIVNTSRNADFWIIKLGTKGELEWDRSFGGKGDDVALGLFHMKDRGYTFWGNMLNQTTNQSDTWIVRMSKEGYIEWEKTIGGFGAEIASSVFHTQDDGFIICGESVFSHEFNSNFWVLKLDSEGDIEFDYEFVGPGKKLLSMATQVRDGSFVISGFNEHGASLQTNLFLLKFNRILNAEDSLYAEISEYVTSDYVGGMFLPIRRNRMKHFEPIVYLTDKSRIIEEDLKITPTNFMYKNKYFDKTYQFQVETETKTLREFNKEGVEKAVPVIKYYGRYGALFARMTTRYSDKYRQRYSTRLRPRWQPRFEERITSYNENYETDPYKVTKKTNFIPKMFSWRNPNYFATSPFPLKRNYSSSKQIKKPPKKQVSLTGYKISSTVIVPMILLWLVILAAIIIKILFSMKR